jgi:hypothetical protein
MPIRRLVVASVETPENRCARAAAARAGPAMDRPLMTLASGSAAKEAEAASARRALQATPESAAAARLDAMSRAPANGGVRLAEKRRPAAEATDRRAPGRGCARPAAGRPPQPMPGFSRACSPCHLAVEKLLAFSTEEAFADSVNLNDRRRIADWIEHRSLSAQCEKGQSIRP